MPKPIQIPRGQKWLTSRAKGLGYKSNDGGVCYGYANVGMYYFFMEPGTAGRLSRFNSMLENIHTYSIETLQKIDSNKSTKHLGVKGFFEGIEVFQQPYLYSGIFNGKPPSQSTQATIETIFPETNYESCGKLSGCYSKTELLSYLTSLGTELKKAKEPVYILLNATKHAIAISYDPANPGQPWSYIDANTGKAISLPVDKMANQIFSGVTFNKKPAFGNENYANFSTEIYAYSESRQKVQSAISSWKSGKDYQNLHTVTDKKLRRQDIWGKGWLYTAARQGNGAEVTEMLKVAEANDRTLEEYDSTEKLSFSVLNIAAERGDLETAKLIFYYSNEHPQSEESSSSESDSETDPDSEEDEDISPYHFLLYAANKGHYKFIEEFLDENALKDLLEKGPNLFHVAARNGHLEVIEALFNRMEALELAPEILNEYINEQDAKGCSFLHIATANNHGNIIEFSMGYHETHPASNIDLKISMKDDSDLTFIQRAIIKKGQENTVLSKIPQQLIDYDADGNPAVQRILALNELADAIANKSDNLDDIIERIVPKSQPEHVANDEVDDELSDEKTEHYFIEDEEDIAVDGDSNTALHIAVAAGDVSVIKRILKAIPDAILEKNDNKQTPLHLACQKGNLEIVKVLLENSEYKPKKILFKKDDNHDTALHLACKEGHDDTVTWLLEQCPEKYLRELIEKENYSGQNLLHIAAFKGLSKVVGTILTIDTDNEDLNQKLLTTMDDFGQTVLHYAVLSGDTETASLILNAERGDLINNSDDDDVDPLLLAITQNDDKMVRFILQTLEETDDKNIRFYTKSKGHEPLLAFAVSGNHLAAATVLVEELLKAKKDIDELPLGQSSDFPNPLTPLALAIDMGHTECAELLLKNGANFDKALRNLDTDIEHLISTHRKSGNEDMAVLLESRLEKQQSKQTTPPAQPSQDNSTQATAENNVSFSTRLRDFFTTPSLGRAVLIGVGVGLLIVAAIAVAITLGVFTGGIAPTVFGITTAAGLSATTAGLSIAAIGAGIIGFFAGISAAVYAASEKIRETFKSEPKSHDYKENLDGHDSQEITSLNKSTVSMIKMGLAPNPDLKSDNIKPMAQKENHTNQDISQALDEKPEESRIVTPPNSFR